MHSHMNHNLYSTEILHRGNATPRLITINIFFYHLLDQPGGKLRQNSVLWKLVMQYLSLVIIYNLTHKYISQCLKSTRNYVTNPVVPRDSSYYEMLFSSFSKNKVCYFFNLFIFKYHCNLTARYNPILSCNKMKGSLKGGVTQSRITLIGKLRSLSFTAPAPHKSVAVMGASSDGNKINFEALPEIESRTFCTRAKDLNHNATLLLKHFLTVGYWGSLKFNKFLPSPLVTKVSIIICAPL